jgi:hypothetical protein
MLSTTVAIVEVAPAPGATTTVGADKNNPPSYTTPGKFAVTEA